MALDLGVETNTGATATYWRIVRTYCDYTDGTGTIHVQGYLSKAARDAGKAPMAERVISCGGDSGVAFRSDPTRAQLYTDILSVPAFAGASSV